jgi:transposase
MVVMVGIDVHKDTHCAVAVDEVGRQLGAARTFRTTDAGNLQLLRWAQREHRTDVVFAVEDCRHLTTRLERALLAAGARVLRVPPKLMAGARQSAPHPRQVRPDRRAGDRAGGAAGAEPAGRRAHPRLTGDQAAGRPPRGPGRPAHAGAEPAALAPARARPDVDPAKRSLDRTVTLDRVQAVLEQMAPDTVRRIALELVADIRALTVRINALEKELKTLVELQAPQLLELPGCGVLTAAKILGETANPTRFRSEACFAMHADVAPIPASSGRTNRHRLARGGNRQLNCALHRIAVTQTRLDGPGRIYYQRRTSSGDTTMEALRALKRRLARVVFTLLQPTDSTAAAALPQAA